jgi:hypothetical protein
MASPLRKTKKLSEENEQKKEEATSGELEDPGLIAMRQFYEKANETSDDGECSIQLKVLQIGEETIELDWSKYIKQQGLSEFKLGWHCLNTNEHNEHRMSANARSYELRKLKSGLTYAVRLYALRKDNTAINRSKYLLLQTCAPPDTPYLKLR